MTETKYIIFIDTPHYPYVQGVYDNLREAEESFIKEKKEYSCKDSLTEDKVYLCKILNASSNYSDEDWKEITDDIDISNLTEIQIKHLASNFCDTAHGFEGPETFPDCGKCMICLCKEKMGGKQ